MGTKCTRAYESIFMNFFEEKDIYPKIKKLCSTYFCFIDGIFMLSNGTKDKQMEFITKIKPPSKHLAVERQQQTYKKKVQNMFKFNNKYTRTISARQCRSAIKSDQQYVLLQTEISFTGTDI